MASKASIFQDPVPDPWEGILSRPTVTKYVVTMPRQLVYDGKMSWDSFIKPFLVSKILYSHKLRYKQQLSSANNKQYTHGIQKKVYRLI